MIHISCMHISYIYIYIFHVISRVWDEYTYIYNTYLHFFMYIYIFVEYVQHFVETCMYVKKRIHTYFPMCRFWLPILRHIHGMPRMCYRHPNGMRSLLKCLGSNGQFQNALCNSEGFTYEGTPCFWERPNLSMKNDRSSTSVFAQTFNTRWFHMISPPQHFALKGRWPGPTWRVGDLFITRPPWCDNWSLAGSELGFLWVPGNQCIYSHIYTHVYIYIM